MYIQVLTSIVQNLISSNNSIISKLKRLFYHYLHQIYFFLSVLDFMQFRTELIFQLLFCNILRIPCPRDERGVKAEESIVLVDKMGAKKTAITSTCAWPNGQR